MRRVDAPVDQDAATGELLLQEPRHVVPRRPDADLGHRHRPPDDAFVDEPFHQRQLGAEAVLVAHGELHAGLVGRLDHRVGLLQGRRDRLLTQDVLARPCRGDDGLGVRGRPRRDSDHLDARIVEEVLVAAVRAVDPEVLGGLLGLCLVDVGDRDEVDARIALQVRQMRGAGDPTRADHPYAELAFGRADVPPCGPDGPY